MLTRLNIQHHRAERPFQPRQSATQRHKARAAHLRGGFKIHLALPRRGLQCFAQIGVIFWLKVQFAWLAPQRHFRIVFFICPIRHIVQRQVRQPQQYLVQQGFCRRFLFARRLNRFFGFGNLGAQLFKQRLVSAGFGLADVFRLRVTRRFGFLLVGRGFAQRRVMGQNIVDLIAQPRLAAVPGGSK